MTAPIRVVDMHTGGEPLRIVTGGFPAIPEGTILQKRAHVRDRLDHLRKFLMFEPRGHADMYGAVLVEPDLPEADMAVLFMHNEGYSTMCGHAVIALGRYAVDEGTVAATGPVARVNIECPCGMVQTDVAIENGRPATVSFNSVPAFRAAAGRTVDVPEYGPVDFDIGYGGAFYAIASCNAFGLEFGRDPVARFAEAAAALTGAVKADMPLSHPDHDDLAFLYGTILTDGHDGSAGRPSRNICVFADRQVDRSPTGSGVTARLAVLHSKDRVPVGEERSFESVTGAVFTGTILRETTAGTHDAVIVRVAGRAHYTGRAEFFLDEGDPLGGGFLLR